MVSLSVSRHDRSSLRQQLSWKTLHAVGHRYVDADRRCVIKMASGCDSAVLHCSPLPSVCITKDDCANAPSSQSFTFWRSTDGLAPTRMSVAPRKRTASPMAVLKADNQASEVHARSVGSMAARGRIILISVNSPGCVSTSIEPPCCLTIMS
jgi:hypothetical protein